VCQPTPPATLTLCLGVVTGIVVNRSGETKHLKLLSIAHIFLKCGGYRLLLRAVSARAYSSLDQRIIEREIRGFS
jgi:hypothetical protein